MVRTAVSLVRNTLDTIYTGTPAHIEEKRRKGEKGPLTSSAYEIEEPLSSRSNGHVHGTESRSWDLADENPADGAPAELE
jgi:hypothetical protein